MTDDHVQKPRDEWDRNVIRMIAMEIASKRHEAKKERKEGSESPQSTHHVLSSCQQHFAGCSAGCGKFRFSKMLFSIPEEYHRLLLIQSP